MISDRDALNAVRALPAALTQLTPSEAYAILEEGLAAGRITPAEFRAREAAVEEAEGA